MVKRIGLLAALLISAVSLTSCADMAIPGMNDPSAFKIILVIGIIGFGYWYVFKRK